MDADRAERRDGAPPVPPRHPLPWERRGRTQKLRVGGQTLYIHTGEYEDGRLGEVFLDVSKQGSTLQALAGAVCMAVSHLLQRGVPLREVATNYVGTHFEPSGFVEGEPEIRAATSILDAVFRWLLLRYAGTLPAERNGVHDAAQQHPGTVPAGADSPAPERLAGATATEMAASRSRRLGYDGSACDRCGSFTLRRAGACLACDTCGATSGCG